MVDRSEWQSPAPMILYSTSPGPGGSRSTDSIVIGWVSHTDGPCPVPAARRLSSSSVSIPRSPGYSAGLVFAGKGACSRQSGGTEPP